MIRYPALSLWQPFAELPMVGLKPWETRSRPYPKKYHGERILIASTKAFTPSGLIPRQLEALCETAFGADYKSTLLRGYARYTIVLKNCEPTETGRRRVPSDLLATGDFSAGRFMWEWGDLELDHQRRVATEMDLHMPTQTDRDFWLLEQAARISETTTGHAHAAINAMARGSVRDRAKDTVERQKEITARFVVFAGTVSPFVYEYDPAMPEPQLRAWAAGVVSALKGE